MRSLLVVLSLIVVLSSGCEMFGKKKRAEQAAIELKAKNDSIAKVKKDAKALKIKKQKAEQARKDSIKKAEEARKKLYKFHVIVGSFKTPKYATAYNDFIGKKGYQSELIMNRYNFQMVSVGAYKSWGDAVRELVKAREAIEPTSWIYIRE
jgi:phosphotransferase system IIB component